jgi:DNA-binding transcriptional ArsR family regulator
LAAQRKVKKKLDTLLLVIICLPLVNTYQQTQQLDAMGDATRRAILARLIEGPLPVGKLAAEFPVSRPAISQHLRILKQANLVVDRAEGTRRLYQLNPEGFDSLREYFEQFWTQALTAFKKTVEQPPAEEK